MKPHKHAELIKAWADGAEIQVRAALGGPWVNISDPQWHEDQDYRISPDDSDVVYTTHIEYDFGWKWVNTTSTKRHNLKLAFDEKTGKLKSAEVIR